MEYNGGINIKNNKGEKIMKKIIKSLSVLLLVVAVMFLVGCQTQNLNFGKKLVKVGGMVDILVELDSNNSDVGVMDSIMAGYYINEEYKGKLMIVPDLELANEVAGNGEVEFFFFSFLLGI